MSRAHQRIGVLHVGIDAQIFVAGLQTVAAQRRRVIEARIDRERILELRVGRLAAQLRKARDGLRRQTARDRAVIGQTGDAIKFAHARPARERRTLAAFDFRHAQAHFKRRTIAERISRAEDELLIQHVDKAVAAAARWARNRWAVELVHLAMADAHETVELGAEIVIESDVELVVEIAVGDEFAVIAGEACFSLARWMFGAGNSLSTLRANAVIGMR